MSEKGSLYKKRDGVLLSQVRLNMLAYMFEFKHTLEYETKRHKKTNLATLTLQELATTASIS